MTTSTTQDSSNVDLVRGTYEASARGDLDAFIAALAPDVSWTEMAGFPYAGTYHGPQEVRTNVHERLGRDWNNWQAHDQQYISQGDQVIVLGIYTADSNKATGKPLEAAVAHAWTVRDGKIVKFVQYVDTLLVHQAMTTRPSD
jgi:uncharacterized protein